MSWSVGTSVRAAGAVLTVVGLAAGLSACGSDSESTTESASTSVTSSVSQPSTTTQARTSAETTTKAPVSSSTTELPPAPVAAPRTTTSSAPPVATTVPMPNVVCMNLQDAQNLIQELGVFYSRSTDATGKGRNQVLDANWVVVGQTPGVGVPIGEGDAVLSVVKLTEPNPC